MTDFQIDAVSEAVGFEPTGGSPGTSYFYLPHLELVQYQEQNVVVHEKRAGAGANFPSDYLLEDQGLLVEGEGQGC
jgi:hypothetical protein